MCSGDVGDGYSDGYGDGSGDNGDGDGDDGDIDDIESDGDSGHGDGIGGGDDVDDNGDDNNGNSNSVMVMTLMCAKTPPVCFPADGVGTKKYLNCPRYTIQWLCYCVVSSILLIAQEGAG